MAMAFRHGVGEYGAVHMETALSPFGEAICLVRLLLFSHHAVGVNLCVIAPLVVAARVDERRTGDYAFSFFSECADGYKKSWWWMDDGLDE
jgi:hypothetical protein